MNWEKSLLIFFIFLLTLNVLPSDLPQLVACSFHLSPGGTGLFAGGVYAAAISHLLLDLESRFILTILQLGYPRAEIKSLCPYTYEIGMYCPLSWGLQGFLCGKSILMGIVFGGLCSSVPQTPAVFAINLLLKVKSNYSDWKCWINLQNTTEIFHIYTLHAEIHVLHHDSLVCKAFIEWLRELLYSFPPISIIVSYLTQAVLNWPWQWKVKPHLSLTEKDFLPNMEHSFLDFEH